MRAFLGGAIALIVTWAGSAGGATLGDPTTDATLFAGLVEKYRHGDSDDAIRELIGSARSLGMMSVMRRAAKAPAKASAPARMALAALPAAVMLHTEAGLYLYGQNDPTRAWVHWSQARALAEVALTERDQDEFLRAWYPALGSYFLGRYLAVDAIDFLEHGLKRFPDEAPIALALGEAHEVRGTFAEGEIMSVRPRPLTEGRGELLAAEHFFRGVLARDPSLVEARLRRGRVLDLLRETDAALAELQQAGTADSDKVRYLAHLFTADLRRRRSELPAAREEFALALEAWPGAQAASLGLAEALHSLGERGEAASVLGPAIEERSPPARPDPFRSYHFGDREEQRRRLEDVKAMARR